MTGLDLTCRGTSAAANGGSHGWRPPRPLEQEGRRAVRRWRRWGHSLSREPNGDPLEVSALQSTAKDG